MHINYFACIRNTLLFMQASEHMATGYESEVYIQLVALPYIVMVYISRTYTTDKYPEMESSF